MLLDKETADLIASALYNQSITDLDLSQLDGLALLRYADDPDVEIDELGLSGDAGWLHGSNTEHEMLHTLGGYNAK